MSFCEN